MKIFFLGIIFVLFMFKMKKKENGGILLIIIYGLNKIQHVVSWVFTTFLNTFFVHVLLSPFSYGELPKTTLQD